MSRVAFDTNILIYADDVGDEKGRDIISREVISRFGSTGAIVPVQVLAEYLNVSRRRAKGLVAAAQRIEDYLSVFEAPATQASDVGEAARMSERFDLAFFDALIATVAAKAGATLLLSEDMHNGLDLGSIRIANPFDAATRAEFGLV